MQGRQGRHLLLVGAAFVAVLACSSWEARAAVISIDFGGEWVKVALVKPGVPMEIVLNKESKRKTGAIVSMRNDERLFGDAALSTGVKYPKSAYRYLQLLLGQKYDSPLVTKYRQWFPYYDIRKDEDRGTILFQHDSDTAYSPEELVAMILNYTRLIAQDYAEQQIRDCVITVPVFYTQAQRRAMLYAANLVGLNVLQLMTDAAATALNYGLFRQASFNTTPQYIMFYDIGALSTTASIIEYKKAQVKEGSVANMYPQLSVKGVGYDRLLGGLEIDIRLRDHLARSFDSLKKTKGSVFDSPRAMGKLLKEAKRVKQVLSANTDHYAQVEGLLEDVDFRLKVTREELETMCSDLYDRIQEPVKQALQAADMTMVEMDSVILMGGGTRVPRFQEALLKAVNKPDLGRSLNTDEAAAMGAVYQAAGQTKLFRVKKFIVKDANVFPIAVSFEKRVGSSEEGEEGGGEEKMRVVKKTLFQRSNTYPQKKVLTFNRYSKDFPFSVYYTSLGFLSEEERNYVGRVNLSEVFLVGVEDTLTKHSEAEAKGIKAHFRMDDSGVLQLDYVESLFEYPPEEEEQSTFAKIGSTLSNLFGGSSEEQAKEEKPSASPPEEAGKEEQEAKKEEGAAGEETVKEEEEEEAVEEEKVEEEGAAEEEEGQGTVDGAETEEIPVEDDNTSQEESSNMESDQSEETGETSDEAPPSEEATPPKPDEQKGEEGEPTPDQKSSESNETMSESGKNVKKEEEPKAPVNRTVKVNLTMEITTLDLTPPSSADVEVSTTKLRVLQERDDEKVANEKAKNGLESFMFETRSWLEVAEVVAVSTEEQRGKILSAVGMVSDWFEEEGYFSAETSVYKEKLRELKRSCRSLKKRVDEAEKRPKLIAQMKESINLSIGFASYMKNISSDMKVFTEVEITTLTNLINESITWLAGTIAQFDTTPPHEDPPVLSHEFEEQQRKLDREMTYLVNKLKSYTPPKPKANATNTSASNMTTSAKTPAEGAAGADDGEAKKAEEEEKVASEDETGETESEAAAEPLELPPAGGDLPTEDELPSIDGTPNEDTLPTSATRGTPRQDL